MTLDPVQVIIASLFGILLLLLLIIKFKVHPILSLLVSSLVIGLGAGLDVLTLTTAVEEGAGKTLQSIVLLIGLGSMFGGILESTNGAKSVAQSLINKFGEKKASIALGVTGLIVGATVFFEAGVMILIPLAFGLSKKTNKSTLFYVIPLLAGLASGFAFVPPSAGSVLVANLLGVDLGLLILIGVPTGILSLTLAGIFYSKFIGKRIHLEVPETIDEENPNLPNFLQVLFIILIPLTLILISTIASYLTLPSIVSSIITFLGTPFIALIIAIFAAMFILGKKQGMSMDDLKNILEKSLKPTASILLVITGGGIISEILQVCGIGDMVSNLVAYSGIPIILIAFLIAGLIRVSVGAAVVSMTMTAAILSGIPEVMALEPLYLAAMVLAINGGATAFSHFNDSGFWLVSSLLGMDEKKTLMSWSAMETIIGLTGLLCAIVIVLFI